MSCNRTICSIWHECDKALGEELKPLCAEESFNSLQQLKAKISEFRESLEWYRDNVDRGYANGFLNKLDEIQKLSAV